MTKLSISALVLAAFLAAAPSAFAADQYQYYIQYASGGDRALLKMGDTHLYNTQQACFDSQHAAEQDIIAHHPPKPNSPLTIEEVYCTCNVPVASSLQPGDCPGYTPPPASTGGGLVPTGQQPPGTDLFPTGQQPPASGGGQPVTLFNPLGTTDLMSFLLRLLDFLINPIGVIIIILMLVYIGFLFATTSVQPENKSKAREYLLWTIIGALILLGAKAIALGIQATVQSLS